MDDGDERSIRERVRDRLSTGVPGRDGDGMDRRDFLKVAGAGAIGLGAAGLLHSTGIPGGRPVTDPGNETGPGPAAAPDPEPVAGPGTTVVTADEGEAGIRDALASMQDDGGTVILGPGTFEVQDTLRIPSNVWLRGSGRNRTAIRLVPGAGQLDEAGLLHVRDASHVIVSDLALDGNRARFETDGERRYGFYSVDASDLVLERLHVHDFPGYGIDPHEPTSGILVTNCIVEDNGMASEVGKDGITFDGVTDGAITETISRYNGRHGINVVSGSENIVLTGNVVSENAGTCLSIQYRQPRSIVVTGNVLEAGAEGGINVSANEPDDGPISEILLSNNIVRDCTGFGIRLNGVQNAVVTGNILHGNKGTDTSSQSDILLSPQQIGSDMYGSKENVIIGNQIVSDTETEYKYGIEERTDHDGPNIIVGNVLDKTPEGIKLETSGTVVSANLGARTGHAGTIDLPAGESTVEVDVDVFQMRADKITVTPNSPLHGGGSFWVSDVREDSFVISTAEPVDEPVTFAWRVEPSG